MFDSRQYLESLSPPQFVDKNGRVHTGRVLSYEEFLPFQERMRQLSKGEPSPSQARSIIRSLCDTLFPRPWWSLRRSVAGHVLRLPPPAALAALQDFSASLDRMYKAAEARDEGTRAD